MVRINCCRYVVLINFFWGFSKYIRLSVYEFSCRNESITGGKFIIFFIGAQFYIIHWKMIWAECVNCDIFLTFDIFRYSFIWWVNIFDAWKCTNIIVVKFWIFALLSINSFRGLINIESSFGIILVDFVVKWDGCGRFHVILMFL